MWLSSIGLKNFKSYREQLFEFPPPQDGRNLILVGGVNGHGKTTLLEALYVGLYGEEALNHKALDRAGLKAKSYGHFLETAFYKHALREGEDRMEVIIVFTRADRGALRVTRKWFFNSARTFVDQKLILQTCAPNGAWSNQLEGMLPELLSSHAIPPWLAPFFFFDGEKISALADEDRTGWIVSGLENLLGVVLVRELRQKLTDYSTKKMKDAGGVDEARVDELKTKRDQEAGELERLATEMEGLQTRLTEVRKERDLCTTLLGELAQGSNARTVAEIAEARSRADQEEKKAWERLRELLAGPLPLQLIRRSLHQSLERSLVGEASLSAWEQGREKLQPRWEQFRDTFFSSDWLRVMVLLPGARESLEKTLAEAWDSLFNPRPADCSDSVWHGYLQEQERRKLVDMQHGVGLSAETLRQTVAAHQQAEQEKWRLQQELIRLQGVDGQDKAVEIERLKNALMSAQQALGELERDLGSKENTHKALRAEVDNLSATYERERKKLVEGHPERIAAREAERVVDMIDDLLPALFEIKLKALSESVTRIFRSLHSKDQVHRIRIETNGQARLLSVEGTEITLAKSHGESKLFVLALVSALAEVTGYRVPLIVDTPLTSLSADHCRNLLDHWVGDKERQVILLAQDKEIDGEDYRRLEPFIAKTYLLKHRQMGHGVGQTEAVAGAFFGEQAR
ncbi:MAG: DNA sulfur modification protein DndD [Pseudomonadota bacterium]|nr:DNA sulfur modification protein DndD [Pseudomonadota bacterium]